LHGISVAASLFQFRSRAMNGADLAAEPAPAYHRAHHCALTARRTRGGQLEKWVVRGLEPAAWKFPAQRRFASACFCDM